VQLGGVRYERWWAVEVAGGSGEAELGAGHLPGDQGLADAVHDAADHRVEVAGERVDGEDDAGEVGGDHHLHYDGHVAGLAVGRPGVGGHAVGGARCPHRRDGRGEPVGGDVEDRLIRAGERRRA